MYFELSFFFTRSSRFSQPMAVKINETGSFCTAMENSPFMFVIVDILLSLIATVAATIAESSSFFTLPLIRMVWANETSWLKISNKRMMQRNLIHRIFNRMIENPGLHKIKNILRFYPVPVIAVEGDDIGDAAIGGLCCFDFEAPVQTEERAVGFGIKRRFLS